MRGVTETRTSIHQSARHGKFVSFICDEGQWIILGGVWWNGVVMTVEWWLEAQEETGSAQISRFEWLTVGCWRVFRVVWLAGSGGFFFVVVWSSRFVESGRLDDDDAAAAAALSFWGRTQGVWLSGHQ
jgi:hypothetical protein